jgi:hypothetical protein
MTPTNSITTPSTRGTMDDVYQFLNRIEGNYLHLMPPGVLASCLEVLRIVGWAGYRMAPVAAIGADYCVCFSWRVGSAYLEVECLGRTIEVFYEDTVFGDDKDEVFDLSNGLAPIHDRISFLLSRLNQHRMMEKHK